MSNFQPLVEAAADFALDFSSRPHPKMRGVKDSKRAGGYVESQFKEFLVARGLIGPDEGNAALGVDLPSWQTDIKSTSRVKPQSSTPFRSFRQRVDGLGHNLLVFVYTRRNSPRGVWFDFPVIRFVPAELTGDHTTTKQLRELIAEGAGEDAVYGWLRAKTIDEAFPPRPQELRAYARTLIESPPAQGCLTVSPALQWRVQYSRAFSPESDGLGVVDVKPPTLAAAATAA